ncbi:MAG: RnfABCDGE type electron transport complex subunit D [Candidatus Omnitrophota bacterium]
MQNQELNQNNLLVSSSPHIQTDDHIVRRMWAVLFALIPAGIAGVYIFGISSLYVICISVLTALVTEWSIQKLRGRNITILDGSALITGLLVSYNLSPNVPFWIPIVGSFVAVTIGKLLFGGLGSNIFNPALVGRVFLMASWPRYMTTWTNPRWQVDAVTTATPLGIVREKLSYSLPSYWDLFIGNRGGCIGEVCIVALLIGALYLLIKKYISWRIPFSFIITVGILNWLLKGDFLFSILAGGLILGAFFMATDYVTAPLTKKGKWIFGFGCGLITFVIRKWGGYPEGVSYAILMMNAATPIIDRFSRPRKYGGKKITGR